MHNNSVPADARQEIKFVSYEYQLPYLLGWIRLHSAGFFQPHPDRWINNVYFDSHSYHAYSQNLSGASQRTKLRYRWYGEARLPEAGILELKCRRNFFGWKRRYPVDVIPAQKGDSWQDIRARISEQISHEGRKVLEVNPVPVLINRYYRKYFVSRNEKVRITVDIHQAVWDQRYRAHPYFGKKANIPHALVVEVKFARQDRELASQILQGIPVRVSRHSKYINGVRAISR